MAKLEMVQKIMSILYYFLISITAVCGVFSFKKWFKPKQFEKLEEIFLELKIYINFITEIEFFIRNHNNDPKDEQELIDEFLKIQEKLYKTYNSLICKLYFSKIYFKNTEFRNCLEDMRKYLEKVDKQLHYISSSRGIVLSSFINWQNEASTLQEVRLNLISIYEDLSNLKIF